MQLELPTGRYPAMVLAREAAAGLTVGRGVTVPRSETIPDAERPGDAVDEIDSVGDVDKNNCEDVEMGEPVSVDRGEALVDVLCVAAPDKVLVGVGVPAAVMDELCAASPEAVSVEVNVRKGEAEPVGESEPMHRSSVAASW